MTQAVKSKLNAATGKRIRKLRLEYHWDQSYVAELLGINASSYSKIESGSTDLNFSRLEQIAAIFQVSVISLLSDHAKMEMNAMSQLTRIKTLLAEREKQIADLRRKLMELRSELDREIQS